MPHPLPEADQQQFVERIQNSPQRLPIAFEFLWWCQHKKDAARYSWLAHPMTRLLGDGAEPPNLAELPDPAEAGKWVFRELREVSTLPEWKAYLASGRHLWLLFAILNCRSNKLALVEALLALAECLAHCQNTPAPGKHKKSGVQPEDPQWIVRLLKSRIPPRLDLPKPFNETLFALNATAQLVETLRAEANGLRAQVQRIKPALEQEKAARAEAEDREQNLKSELSNKDTELESARRELDAEKRHTVRTGGFGGVARQEVINHVLSDVRRGLASRLENIRHFADRENPNRHEIVELVREIERHLATAEQRIQS